MHRWRWIRSTKPWHKPVAELIWFRFVSQPCTRVHPLCALNSRLKACVAWQHKQVFLDKDDRPTYQNSYSSTTNHQRSAVQENQAGRQTNDRHKTWKKGNITSLDFDSNANNTPSHMFSFLLFVFHHLSFLIPRPKVSQQLCCLKNQKIAKNMLGRTPCA